MYNVWHRNLDKIMTVMRKKRLLQFEAAYHDLEQLSVLDVGGMPLIWNMLKKRPKKLVILNLEKLPAASNYETVAGDGRCLHYEENEFDLVFCNSVIEHVGSIEDQQSFAREVMRVGKEIYIQTPNSHFPVEPHLMMPFVHWLPRGIYRQTARISPWAIFNANSKDDAVHLADGIRLLDAGTMKKLFSGLEPQFESFFGFNKSIIMPSRRL